MDIDKYRRARDKHTGENNKKAQTKDPQAQRISINANRGPTITPSINTSLAVKTGQRGPKITSRPPRKGQTSHFLARAGMKGATLESFMWRNMWLKMDEKKPRRQNY